MSWSWFENRHVIRAIKRWASELWSEGKSSEALEIFRSLLRTNPDDNIGARFCILAIRMGLGPDYEERFLVERGFIDAEKISRWFERHSRKSPDEFGWWWKEIEKLYGKIG